MGQPSHAALSPREVVIGPGWVIAHGRDVVTTTAANQLARWLASEHEITVSTQQVIGRQGDITAWLRRVGLAEATGVVVVGTTSDNELIATAQRQASFGLSAAAPEGFRVSDGSGRGQQNVLYVVGQSAKGAMNGVFRLEEELRRRRSLDVSRLEMAQAPVFVNRVGGHKFTQSPPPGWTEDQQAEYYASNYINVVWGEKHGPPLSLAARQAWGLNLAYEVTLPPVDQAWMNDPANTDAIYLRGSAKTIDPFHDRGRQAYADGFAAALTEYPDIAILETIFGDYSHVPDRTSKRLSDGTEYGRPVDDVAVEIMRIMKEVIGTRAVTPIGWLWHLYPEGKDASVMGRLRDVGVGVLYNEDGNGDCWISRRTNFNDNAIATDPDTGRTKWGADYTVLVSAGGSCESVKPAIGLPLPHMAASKLRKLSDIGVQNFYLWWGGVEGWTYSANLSAIREMIWTPGDFNPGNSNPFNPSSPEPLMSKIADADFGVRAQDILRYWGAVDSALIDPAPDGSTAGLPVYSWYQRLAIYLNPRVFGGGAALRPLTPSGLKSNQFSVYRPWGVSQATIDAFSRVADDLAAANALGQRIDDGGSARLAQMRRWTEIYTHVFTSRLHFLQGLRVTGAYSDVEDPAFRTALLPIAQAELSTLDAMRAALAALAPNATFFSGTRPVFNDAGDRDTDLRLIDAKRVSIQVWLDGLSNVALGRPASASSAPDSTQTPAMAVDGQWSTQWKSAGRADGSENEWLAVDLGAARPIEAVVVRWSADNAASHYKIETAEATSGPWVSVADITDPSGRDDGVVLPTGTSARHVRVLGLARANFNFTVKEFEVYGAP